MYREQFEKENALDKYSALDRYGEYIQWLEKQLANKEHAILLLKEQIKMKDEKLQKAIECLEWLNTEKKHVKY